MDEREALSKRPATSQDVERKKLRRKRFDIAKENLRDVLDPKFLEDLKLSYLSEQKDEMVEDISEGLVNSNTLFEDWSPEQWQNFCRDYLNQDIGAEESKNEFSGIEEEYKWRIAQTSSPEMIEFLSGEIRSWRVPREVEDKEEQVAELEETKAELLRLLELRYLEIGREKYATPESAGREFRDILETLQERKRARIGEAKVLDDLYYPWVLQQIQLPNNKHPIKVFVSEDVLEDYRPNVSREVVAWMRAEKAELERELGEKWHAVRLDILKKMKGVKEGFLADLRQSLDVALARPDISVTELYELGKIPKKKRKGNQPVKAWFATDRQMDAVISELKEDSEKDAFRRELGRLAREYRPKWEERVIEAERRRAEEDLAEVQRLVEERKDWALDQYTGIGERISETEYRELEVKLDKLLVDAQAAFADGRYARVSHTRDAVREVRFKTGAQKAREGKPRKRRKGGRKTVSAAPEKEVQKVFLVTLADFLQALGDQRMFSLAGKTLEITNIDEGGIKYRTKKDEDTSWMSGTQKTSPEAVTKLWQVLIKDYSWDKPLPERKERNYEELKSELNAEQLEKVRSHINVGIHYLTDEGETPLQKIFEKIDREKVVAGMENIVNEQLPTSIEWSEKEKKVFAKNIVEEMIEQSLNE